MKKRIKYSFISAILLIVVVILSLWGPYWIHLYVPGLNLGNRIRVRDYCGRNSASIRARYGPFLLSDALYDEELYTLWIGYIDNEKYVRKYPYGTDAVKIKWGSYENHVLYVSYRYEGRYHTDTLNLNKN